MILPLVRSFDAIAADYAAATGARLRDARPADAPLLEQIARASFPALDEHFDDPANLAHHHDLGASWQASGAVVARVVEQAGGALAAYVYYQLRRDGDVYLRELAALPPEPAAKVPLAGTFLLYAMLDHALCAGQRGLSTLNVVRECRAGGGEQGPRDPARYYERLGYQIVPGAAGYRLSGEPRRPQDTWMEAPIARAHEAAREALERRIGASLTGIAHRR